MEENKRIADLFERARTEAPKTSFDEAKKHLLAASAVGSVGIIAKFMAASFKVKAIIMLGIVSTLTVSGLLIFNSGSDGALRVFQGSELDSSLQGPQCTTCLDKQSASVEISSANGIEKTVVFDDQNQVINVTIDSSNKTRKPIQIEKLASKQLVNVPMEESGSIQSSNFKEFTSKRANPADSLTFKKFTITHNTSAEELKNISAQAKDAGIEFAYDTRIRRGVIKKIEIAMVLNSGNDKSKWGAKISGSSSFSFEFGWREDASGKAVNLYDGCK